MATILIYGYDLQMARKLCDPLRREKHSVTICEDDEPIPSGMASPPLVILDAQLRWVTCRPLFEQCKSLGCPVLFLTADRSMVGHLRALYPGPSDVLTLPFAPKTLISKVTGLLGAQEGLRELTVNEQERVAHLDGQRVELTAQEFALLLVLMENPDMPISREQLLRKAWGYQSMGDTRTVDVHVQRLRKKLGGERIETVYKCGYRLKMA
jgi:DNA-binding response OmpR family regulator